MKQHHLSSTAKEVSFPMASDEPESQLALTLQTFQNCGCHFTEQLEFFAAFLSDMVADENYPKKLHDTKSYIIEHSGIFAHLHLKIMKELFELIGDLMVYFTWETFGDFHENIGHVAKLASDLKIRTNLVKLLFNELLLDVSTAERTGKNILGTEEADRSKHEGIIKSADAKINQITTTIENTEDLKQTVTASLQVAGTTAVFISPAVVPVAAVAGVAYVTIRIQDISLNAQISSKEKKLRYEMEKKIKNSADIIDELKGTIMQCIAAFYEGTESIANMVDLIDVEIKFLKERTDENVKEENFRSKKYRFKNMATRAMELKEWCGHYFVVSGKIDRDLNEVLKGRIEVGSTQIWLDQKWKKLKQSNAHLICPDYYKSIIETCNLPMKQVPVETFGEKLLRIICG